MNADIALLIAALNRKSQKDDDKYNSINDQILRERQKTLRGQHLGRLAVPAPVNFAIHDVRVDPEVDRRASSLLPSFSRNSRSCFSGSKSNGEIKVRQFLHEMVNLQSILFLSQSEYIRAVLNATKSGANDLIRPQVDNDCSAEELHYYLLNAFDDTESPAKANDKLRVYKTFKGSNIGNTIADIERLAQQASLALPSGVARQVFKDLSACNALIHSLPRMSSNMLKCRFAEISQSPEEPPTYCAFVKSFDPIREVIDQDIELNGYNRQARKFFNPKSKRVNEVRMELEDDDPEQNYYNTEEDNYVEEEYEDTEEGQDNYAYEPEEYEEYTENWYDEEEEQDGQDENWVNAVKMERKHPAQRGRTRGRGRGRGLPTRTTLLPRAPDGRFQPRGAGRGTGQAGRSRGRFRGPGVPGRAPAGQFNQKPRGASKYCSLCGTTSHNSSEGCRAMINDKGEVILSQCPTHTQCQLCSGRVKKPLHHPEKYCIYRPGVKRYMNPKVLEWNLK
jgi:hypothetical protein